MATLQTGKATELITFSRTSNATVTDSNGVIKWAPHNLLLASEQFDNSNWVKTRSTVTANTIAAPNGTTTAEKIVEDSTASNDHRIQQTVAVQGSVTASAFMKAAERTWGYIRVDDASSALYAYFDLSTGSLGNVSAGLVASITPVGGGWYFCSAVLAAPAVTNLGVFVIGPSTSGSTTIYTGNGTSGIYLWGASLTRSDLGGMQANTSAYPMYNPTTPKNLLGFTESFENAAWTRNAIQAFGSGSITNAVIAPNGLQTADKIVETTANAGHNLTLATGTIVSGTRYIVSVYMKAAERGFGLLQFNAGNNAYGTVNLSTGATNLIAGSGTLAAVDAGNGWWRVSLSAVVTATSGFCSFYLALDATTFSYTGDGVSGIYLWGAQLSDSASLDTYVPNNGPAPTAAAYYGPRLDFDPVTLAAKGLLVEEARANLLLQSAAFDSASWSAVAGATVTANTTVSPDGMTTADTVTFNTTNGNRLEQSSGTAVNGETVTFSLWMKGSGTIKINVGTDTGVGGSTENTITLTAAWVRYSATVTYSSPTGVRRGMIIWRTGDTATAVNIWGAQLEAGSFATSYIPTGAATATRAADVASVSTQAFPYGATEGTLVAAVDIIGYPNNTSWGLSALAPPGSSTANYMGVTTYSSDGTKANASFRLNSRVSGSFEADVSILTAPDLNATYKLAAALKQNDFAACANGGAVSTDATVTLPANIAVLNIGQAASGASTLNGHIRQITYIPRRLSNTELQARTV